MPPLVQHQLARTDPQCFVVPKRRTQQEVVTVAEGRFPLINIGSMLRPSHLMPMIRALFEASAQPQDESPPKQLLLYLTTRGVPVKVSRGHQIMTVPTLYLATHPITSLRDRGEGILIPFVYHPDTNRCTLLMSRAVGRNVALVLYDLIFNTRLPIDVDTSEAVDWRKGPKRDLVTSLHQAMRSLSIERTKYIRPLSDENPPIPQAVSLLAGSVPIRLIGATPKQALYEAACEALDVDDLDGQSFYLISGGAGIIEHHISGGLWVASKQPSQIARGQVVLQMCYSIDTFIIRMSTVRGNHMRQLILAMWNNTDWKCLHDGSNFSLPHITGANILKDDAQVRRLWNQRRALYPETREVTIKDEDTLELLGEARPVNEVIAFDEQWLDIQIIKFSKKQGLPLRVYLNVAQQQTEKTVGNFTGPLLLTTHKVGVGLGITSIPIDVTKTSSGLRKVIASSEACGPDKVALLDILLSRAQLGLTWNGMPLDRIARHEDREAAKLCFKRWQRYIEPHVTSSLLTEPNTLDAVELLPHQARLVSLPYFVRQQGWNTAIVKIFGSAEPPDGTTLTLRAGEIDNRREPHFESALLVAKKLAKTNPKDILGTLSYHAKTKRWVIRASTFSGEGAAQLITTLLLDCDWGLSLDGTLPLKPRNPKALRAYVRLRAGETGRSQFIPIPLSEARFNQQGAIQILPDQFRIGGLHCFEQEALVRSLQYIVGDRPLTDPIDAWLTATRKIIRSNGKLPDGLWLGLQRPVDTKPAKIPIRYFPEDDRLVITAQGISGNGALRIAAGFLLEAKCNIWLDSLHLPTIRYGTRETTEELMRWGQRLVYQYNR